MKGRLLQVQNKKIPATKCDGNFVSAMKSDAHCSGVSGTHTLLNGSSLLAVADHVELLGAAIDCLLYTSRIRIAASCARVALSAGFRVPSV